MENQKIQENIDSIKADFERKIQQIQSNGAKRINEITDESPDPNNIEATLKVTFDVQWKNTSLKFDIPKFSSQLQHISFDVPSVKMVTKSFSWDEPATKMERRCITKKPEMVCHGLKCTVKMTCVYGNVPVVYMKRREIKTDVPEFTMKRQDISFNKPTVTFETIEIVLRLPQFYLRSLTDQLKEQQEEFEDVNQEMTSEIAVAKNQMDNELMVSVSGEISGVYEGIRKELLTERDNVSNYYEDSINKLKTAVKGLKENNAVEEVAKLESQLSNLVSEFAQILSEIDKGIEEIKGQESDALNNLKLS